jgi:opacity protein-like surface antigen
MKRTILPIALAILFSKNLVAQDRLEHFTFDVGGGFSLPVGQLQNRADTGFAFVASGGPRFSPRLSVDLDFALHYFNVKNPLPSAATGVNLASGAVVRTWSLTVNPAYQFIRRERSSYYATAGYGLYNRHLENPVPQASTENACDPFWSICVNNSGSSVTGNINPYKAGYNVGGGVNLGGRTKFFIEVRYHHMFTSRSPTEYIPITFGVRW